MTDPSASRSGPGRALLWGLVAASALAVVVLGLLIGSRHRQAEASLQRLLARQALLEAENSPETGLLLALEGVRHEAPGPLGAAESALRSILPRIYRSETIPGPKGTRQLAVGADAARPWLAVLDAAGAVFLVDTARSGAPARLAGPANSAIAFNSVGTRLAVAGVDGVVRLWDPEAPGAEARFGVRHAGPVTALAFHPNGLWLAVGGGESTTLYPLESADPAADSIEVPRPEATDLAGLVFSRDGRWLAVAPRANRPGDRQWPVQIWDLSDLPDLPAAPEDLYQAGEATALVFSPASGDALLATAHRDGRVLLWQREEDAPGEGSWSGEVLREAWFPVSTLAFEPSGRWLATASDHGRRPTVLWEIEPGSGRFGSNQREVQTDGPVTALVFSADGLRLAAGGPRQPPGVWNLIGPAAAPILLPHASRVGGVGFSGDGRWLATVGRGEVRLWSLSDPSGAQAVALEGDLRVSMLAASPGSALLAMADRAGAVEVVAPTEGGVEVVRRIEQEDAVRLLALSPDGRWLATSVGDEDARLWDLSSAASEGLSVLGAGEPGADPEEEPGFPTALGFDPRGRWLAQIRSDGSADLGRVPGAAAEAGGGRPRASSTREVAYAFSANGRWLATGAIGGDSSRVWNLDDETPRATVHATPPGLLALAFAAEGGFLKLASTGGGSRARVSVLSLNDSAPTPMASVDHVARLQDALLSPDGRWLVTVSGDLTAQLLDASGLGSDHGVARLTHAATIQGLEFSPDGRWLATTSLDRVVRLWALDLDELVGIGCRSLAADRRGFSRQEWERIFPPSLHSGGGSPSLRYRSSYARICPSG